MIQSTADTTSSGGIFPGSQPISMRLGSAPMVLWVAATILLGSLQLGEGIYVSQFLLIALCAASLAKECYRRRYGKPAIALLIFVVLTIWSVSVGGAANPRFIPEYFKTVLLLVSGVILSDTVTWRDLRAVVRVLPMLSTLVVLATYLLGIGDYYGDEGRFGVPWWGSPNSTGFILALSVACVLFDMIRPRAAGGRSPGSRLFAIVLAVELLVLLGFLAMTQSLGGLLSVAVVLLRYAGLRLKTILISLATATVVAIVVVLLVPSIEVPQLIGSGRLVIWQTLITDLLANPPAVWIFGRGPGAIDLTLWFTASVQSAHSMYVEVLYGFGLVGLAIMLRGIYGFARALSEADIDATERKLIEAVFGAVIVGFFVDTYLMSAQLTWLGAMLISWGGLLRRRETELEREN